MSNYSKEYILESIKILESLDIISIEKIVKIIENIKQQNGRLFILGVGGSAGTASHAVNDFRKICNLEAYTPTDNVSELTARINDEGWDTCYAAWLKSSKLTNKDGILILSVGGGNSEKKISQNLVKAIDFAIESNSSIIGIVGKDGGYTYKMANSCLIIPPLIEDKITPHTEGLCSVILHLIVSHPSLKINPTKWESTK